MSSLTSASIGEPPEESGSAATPASAYVPPAGDPPPPEDDGVAWAEPSGTAVPLELLLGAAPLPLPRVMTILRDVAGVLDTLGARGKAYGAISPSTIRVDEAGRARLVAPSDVEQLRPGYLAPEQRHGDPSDARLDQYALGVVAYELLTGERRETHIADASHLDVVNDMRLGPEHVFRPGFGPGVNEVIRRAIARDPKWRFESATAFVQSLATQIDAPPPVVRVDEDVVERVATARFKRASRVTRGSSGMSPASRLLVLSTYGLVILAGLMGLTYLLLSVTGQTVGGLGGGGDRRESFLASLGRTLGIGAGGGAAGGGAGGANGAAAGSRGFVTVQLAGIASASILVDGQPAGTAPATISVATGLHVIEVRAPGRAFVPPITTVTVTANDTSTASFGAP